MSEFIQHYFTFYYVALTLFALVGIVVVFKLLFARKKTSDKSPSLSFKNLNNRFDKELTLLEKELYQAQDLSKEVKKLLKKTRKKEKKAEKANTHQKTETLSQKIKEQLNSNMKTSEIFATHSQRVFVLRFTGNLMASEVEYLRHEISFILQTATAADEIVVCVNSPGGSVSHYGLASSQLARFKQAKLPLTVCVDVVAASGGYMMAAVADKIVAAPFAFVGSIGVVAGVPNFHKVMKKNEIDYHLFTAGKYKRTVTPLTEVTEEGKEKFQESLTDIHIAFKEHIQEYRKNLDIEAVATGEYWLAVQAKEKGLVDEIMTSDDYLITKMKDHEVIEISMKEPQSLAERLVRRGLAFFHKSSLSKMVGFNETEPLYQRFQ